MEKRGRCQSKIDAIFESIFLAFHNLLKVFLCWFLQSLSSLPRLYVVRTTIRLSNGSILRSSLWSDYFQAYTRQSLSKKTGIARSIEVIVCLLSDSPHTNVAHSTATDASWFESDLTNLYRSFKKKAGSGTTPSSRSLEYAWLA